MFDESSKKFSIDGNHVLFFYIHDKQEPRRVATLARYRDENRVYYAWAINRFTEEAVYAQRFDFFTKKRGREIAFGRLQKTRSRRMVELDDTTAGPLEAMLTDIADDAPIDDMSGVRDPAPNLSVPQRLVTLAAQAIDRFREELIQRRWLEAQGFELLDGEEDDHDDDEFEDEPVSSVPSTQQLTQLFNWATEALDQHRIRDDESNEESNASTSSDEDLK